MPPPPPTRTVFRCDLHLVTYWCPSPRQSFNWLLICNFLADTLWSFVMLICFTFLCLVIVSQSPPLYRLVTHKWQRPVDRLTNVSCLRSVICVYLCSTSLFNKQTRKRKAPEWRWNLAQLGVVGRSVKFTLILCLLADLMQCCLGTRGALDREVLSLGV